MLRFKDLMERINETRYLSEGPTHLEYSGHVGEKEYAVKVPRHKDLGDYSEKDLHHKISKENPHLHHHEVTAIVNSGGEEESHEKVEHEGKTHTHHVINYQEPRHLYNEEVDLDESRMKDLAMDMESLSHEDFKKKHRRTKQEMQDALKSEALKGNQHKIDANKNGKVDGHDFKILRNAKKARYQ
jgi:hypothetical protein